MNFITDNLLLISIAVVSGFALLLPNLQRRGARVSQLQATQYMNQAKPWCWTYVAPKNLPVDIYQVQKKYPARPTQRSPRGKLKVQNNVVITVCQSGVRSANAVNLLTKAGFTQVFSLDGGVAEWKAQSLPTVK